MRTRRFTLAMKVSNRWFLNTDPDEVRRLVRDQLRAEADEMRGPRGGRYVRVGEPYGYDEGIMTDDFVIQARTFTARVNARYVRPQR